MNFLSKAGLILPVFFISTTFVCSQSQLEFVHKKNNKVLSYQLGDRIGYTRDRHAFIKSGKLQAINDTTITVSNIVVPIDNLKFIGHRKKGTGIVTIGTAFLAGAALGYFTLPGDNTTAEKMTGLAIAIPMFTVGQIVYWKNRMFNIRKNYRHKKAI